MGTAGPAKNLIDLYRGIGSRLSRIDWNGPGLLPEPIGGEATQAPMGMLASRASSITRSSRDVWCARAVRSLAAARRARPGRRRVGRPGPVAAARRPAPADRAG